MKLVNEDHPVLREPCKLVDFNEVDVNKLSTQLIDTMLVEDGIGLAAPQVGLGFSMFVIGDKDTQMTVINPSIIHYSEEVVKTEEGCLSFPNLWLKVSRAESIVAKYYNEKEQEKEMHLKDLWSRCFQHELDHLNGICFTQYVSRMVLERAKKARKKQERKNV